MKRLVVITGVSGSGKSLAANCFEDLGFFCVDNLPVGLILPFCDLIQRSGDRLSHAALVVDARERVVLDEFPAILQNLRERKLPVELLFFECTEDVLKRRYSETRRPHPLASKEGTLEEALRSERAALAPLHAVSDRVIDTSRFTSHQLKAFIRGAYGGEGGQDQLNLNVLSFGFKYGVPTEVDLVFDVRFLPNPYFVAELRDFDGRSTEIQEFLDKIDQTHQFMERLEAFLDFLIPLYGAEGKTYLTIGLGCTGGKHRSVALAERIGRHLSQQDWPLTINHRDVGRE